MTNDPKLHFKFAHIRRGPHIFHSYVCIHEKLRIFKNRYYMPKCDILFRKWRSTGRLMFKILCRKPLALFLVSYAACLPTPTLYLKPRCSAHLGERNLSWASFCQKDPFAFSPTTEIQPIDIRPAEFIPMADAVIPYQLQPWRLRYPFCQRLTHLAAKGSPLSPSGPRSHHRPEKLKLNDWLMVETAKAKLLCPQDNSERPSRLPSS